MEGRPVEADLLIVGGTLVTEQGSRRADLAIRGGVVAAVVEPGDPAPEARECLDATGLHLLPGVVDCHVHFNQPGRTDWEGYATGTAAAAAGGTTTVLDMPLNCHPPTLGGAAFAEKRRAVASHAYVDYGLWGGYVGTNLPELAALIESGAVGCKAFTCDSGLEEFPAVGERALRRGMERLGAIQGILGLHAESPRLTERLAGAARAAGARGPDAWASARPPRAELEAVQAALRLARDTGVRLHFVHLSTPEAIARVAAARTRPEGEPPARLGADAAGTLSYRDEQRDVRGGVDATAETCPHYLALDEDDFARLGPIAKCAPPLRSRQQVERLWDAVLAGQVDVVASDHSPCPPAAKARGSEDIWQAWGGISGVQTLLPVLLTEGVHARGLDLSRLAALVAANPARRFGLYPRKGTLQVGSDADLALVDLERRWTLRVDDLKTRWPLSPFVGRTFHGRVEATLVRGVVVYRDGRITGPPGHGQFVRPRHPSGAEAMSTDARGR